MTEISLIERARLIGGVRYEDDQLTIDAFSTLGSPVVVKKHWQDVLPSLALNYTHRQRSSFASPATQTLARPEYRELAPITSRDVLNGDDMQGNDKLSARSVTNADMRWEWYPRERRNPELWCVREAVRQSDRACVSGSGSARASVFYTNAEQRDELRRRGGGRERSLGFSSPSLERLQAFMNVDGDGEPDRARRRTRRRARRTSSAAWWVRRRMWSTRV